MRPALAALLAVATVSCTKETASAPAPKPTEPDAADPLAGIALPEVQVAGATRAGGTLVRATPAEIRVGAAQVAAIHGGAIDAANLDGARMPALASALAGSPRAPVELAVDRSLPYRVLTALLLSGSQDAGRTVVTLLVRANGAVVGLPIAIPSRAPVSIGGKVEAIQAERSEPRRSRGTVAIAGAQADEAIVQKIRAAYTAGLERCYASWLATHPAAKGTAALAFELTGEGRVASPTMKGIAPELAGCMTELALTWRFARPTGAPPRIALTVTLAPRADATAHVTGAPLAPPPQPAPLAGQVAGGARATGTPPLGMIVGASRTELLVWSVSGEEGTLREPALRVALADRDALATLRRTLAAIAERRWSGGARPPETQQIVLMCDGATPVQTVAELYGAIQPAFSEIMLGAGIE